MSLYTGAVESVVAEPRQANVTTDAAAGSSTLLLDNVGPFLQAGGQAIVDGVLLDYLTVDTDLESMTLAAPLAALVPADSTVQAAQQGTGVIDWKVNVVLDGQEGLDDEPVPATITHEHIPYLREGVADAGKRVTLSATAKGLYLDEIDGGVPLVDGSYLDPDIPLDPAIVPPGDPGLTWQGSWNPAIAYVVNDAVAYSGASYRRTVPGTTATDPATDTTNWELIADRGAAGLSWTGAWDAATAYAVSDAVTYNGSSYRRKVAGTTAGSPDTDTANWEGVAVIDYLLAGTIDNESGTFRLGVGTVKKIEATGPLGDLIGLAAIDPTNPDVPNGFYSFGAPAVAGEQGPVRVHFPVDGKPNIVSGTSEFDSLTAREFTLDGTQTVSPGKQIVLGGQVQAPKNAPAVNADWHTVQHTGGHVGSSGWDYAGLTVGHDGNWRAVSYDNTTTYRTAVESYHPTTGALVSSTTINGFDARGGIVYSSAFTGRYYMLGAVEGVGWRIRAYDTALTLVWESGVVLADTTPDNIPVIGWDHVTSGGRLLLASIRNVFQTLSIDTYNPTSGALGTATTWSQPGGYSYAYDLGYVARVTTESGDRYVFRKTASELGAPFQVFTTASVHQTSEEWPSAQSSACRGGWWDGTRFWSLDNNGRRRRYETGRCMWTSGSAVREVQYDWADTTGTTHFTMPSPKASLTLPKRARISVTVQTIPVGAGGVDDPNAARIFVGVGTGVVNGSMNLEKTIVAPASSWSLDSSVAQESATTHPATSNGFGTASPAALVGTGGTFVDATGTIPASPFRDSIRAALNGSYAEAWTTYTPSFTAATTALTAGSFTKAGRYIQRGKTVTFTVVITSTAASGYGTGAYEIGLPVTARNADEVVVTSQQSTPNRNYVGRAQTTSVVRLYRTTNESVADVTETGMTNGTVLRINGTYEAA